MKRGRELSARYRCGRIIVRALMPFRDDQRVKVGDRRVLAAILTEQLDDILMHDESPDHASKRWALVKRTTLRFPVRHVNRRGGSTLLTHVSPVPSLVCRR